MLYILYGYSRIGPKTIYYCVLLKPFSLLLLTRPVFFVDAATKKTKTTLSGGRGG